MAGKGFDAKAFLVNHTEKLVLGAAGLMVLAFLVSSQWFPYKGTPNDITDKVSKSRGALVGHTWPEEEKLKYEMTQKRTPKQVVHDNLRNPIAVSQYEMSTRFVSSPWQGKEPLREPSLLTLEDALATAGKVLIERPLDPSKVEEEVPAADPKLKGKNRPGDKPQAAPTTPKMDDEFESSRPAASGDLAGSSGLPGHGAPVAMPSGAAGGPGSAPANAGHGASSPYGESGMYGGMGGGALGPVREAQGYYFASVRAVFPLKDQIRKFQDAIHAKTFDTAAFSFEIIDFNLERQELIGSTKNWTEWQPVDTQSAFDVLNQSMPPEPDIVSGTVTNNVITMPLPPRIYGNWRKTGSHFRIDNFELTDEQVQLEIEYQAKLLELMRDNKKKTDVKPRREKGGFSAIMGDSRALQSEVLGGSTYGDSMGSSPYGGPSMSMPGGMPGKGGRQPAGGRGPASPQNEMLKKLLETDDKDAQSRALKQYIQERVTANGELLLFRYMDFTVESGKTYRYRVRLVLNNPNFGHLASEANGEALVVEGETRTTEWSNVTEPVTLERDIYYFVKDVDSRNNKTKVAIYKWDTTLGTTVAADLDLYPGQHIAGSVKTNVIDPAKSTNEDGKLYEFKSTDVFVDTHADVSLDKTLHKDLKLPGGSKGDALLPEEVLVVQANTGELAVLDPIRQAAEQKHLEDYQMSQAAHFESLKASVPTGTDMMMGSGMMGSEMDNPYSQGTPKKGSKSRGGRSSNPLSGSSGMGSGMGMSGSGMGMPAGSSRGRGSSGRQQQP